jgi:hypothetical protein
MLFMSSAVHSAEIAQTTSLEETPPPEAISACSGLTIGNACRVQVPDYGVVEGTCGTFSNALVCFQKEPPSDTATSNVPDDFFAYFDGNKVHLPETKVSASNTYYVSLSLLSGMNPMTFELDFNTLQAVTAVGQANANFDPATGILNIPAVRVGKDWYAVNMRLTDPSRYRFELIDYVPVQKPDLVAAMNETIPQYILEDRPDPNAHVEILDPAAALAKIVAFAKDIKNPLPTQQDFISAGLKNVTADMVEDFYGMLDTLTAEDVDSLAKLEAIFAKIANGNPITFSKDLIIPTGQTRGELELDAQDRDSSTLTYQITEQPKNGTARLEGNKLTYEANTGFSGYDELTFTVSDGIETSPPGIISISVGGQTAANAARRALRRVAVEGRKHILWFNGSSEELSDTAHLFSRLEKSQYTAFNGWGVSPNDSGMKFVNSNAVGINPVFLGRINDYIASVLNDKQEAVKNSQHLMVGGFSRGAAFFVPYFLSKLNDFLPGIEGKMPNGTPKDLVIFVMDPVHGSGSRCGMIEKTLCTLKALNLEDKRYLLASLREKGFNVSLIFISSGFDYRQSSFIVDKSFYEIRDQFYANYTAKVGLTHATLSTWSKDASGVLSDLHYGTSKKWFGVPVRGVKDNSPKRDALKSELAQMQPDLKVTRSIFRAFLNERINDPSSEPGTLSELSSIVARYHQKTEEYLGDSAANGGWLVEYGGQGKMFPLWAASGNVTYDLRGHSRLGVGNNGSLSAVLPWDYDNVTRQ